MRLAQKFNLHIFSIDSLSIYKGIDIASAKPNVADLEAIKHYGINVLNPNEKCNVGVFLNLLCEVIKCENPQKLLIVGGSSFYLKSIIDGLSDMPKVSEITEQFITKITQNRTQSYALLQKIDSDFAKKISPNDSFRIAKGLQIFFATHQNPTAFFAKNPRQKLPLNIKIFELIKSREILKKDIQIRTERMFEMGLVNEVQNLYDNFPHSQTLKAIGIKEIIAFLDAKITLEAAKNAIIKNTLALAKRQRTFNRTQLGEIPHLDAESLEIEIIKYYESML